MFGAKTEEREDIEPEKRTFRLLLQGLRQFVGLKWLERRKLNNFNELQQQVQS